MTALQAQTPAGTQELLNVRGITPLRLLALGDTLLPEQVADPKALLHSCEQGLVTQVKGFGEKSVQQLMQDLRFYLQYRNHLRWPQALELAEYIESLLDPLPFELLRAGALLRQSTLLNQLEWFCVVETPYFEPACIESVVQALEPLNLAANLVTRECISPYRWTGTFSPTLPTVCLLHSQPSAAVNNQLLSSSGAHLGYIHEQQALFETLHTQRFNSCAAAYAAVGLKEVPPILREGPYSQEQLMASNLIQTTDLQGVLHVHSTYSDGQDNLRSLAEACIALGYAYLGITDHSQSAFYANGLNPDRIRAQHEEIDLLNQELAPFRIFKGIEVDILADGTLDYTNEVLSWFDFTIGSVHSGLQMAPEVALERLLLAIANPYMTMLGHWTGRLLAARAGYTFDYERVIAACAQHQVAIEFNASPWRLEIDWTWLGYLQAAGVLTSINPDAHSIAGLADMPAAVCWAQKGLLHKQYALNTFTTGALQDFFEQKKATQVTQATQRTQP